MPRLLRLNKGVEQGLRELLRFLLESGRVRGVFSLTKEDETSGVAYSLITDPSALKDAVPLYPVMPANAGKVLSRLTWAEPADEPVAAVVRPCELRGLVELLKRSQGSLDNFLFVSPTCGGVYPVKTAVSEDIGARLPQYWDAVQRGEIPADLRRNCMGCTEFVPYTADMTVGLIGNGSIDGCCEISLNTRKAEEIVTGMDGEMVEQELNVEAIEMLRSKREAEKKKLFDELGTEALDVVKVFEKCIGCHNCSKVCVACYCRTCFFDFGPDEHDSQHYEAELGGMGCVSIVPDPIFYHLVRLSHVSLSCVGCGLCGDVCPVNIPVGAVALKTSEAVQKAFGYVAGKSIEEELPTTTFTSEEFLESDHRGEPVEAPSF